MTQGEELRRLMRYLAPHSPALAVGVLLMAGMGVAEGLVAFAIKPAIDVVLNPQSSLQKLVLFHVPGTDRIVYMNDFVPARVHHVWSVFALALLFIFLFQAFAEYFGATLIQYVGLAGITDLRNRVYARVVQQPVGFFHDNPVGRVMSAVISDIEQVRSAFSDYLADFFRQIFSLVIFVVVLLVVDWRMAIGAAVLVPLVVWPVGKLTRRIRRSTEKSRSRLADLSQILQETISGNRVVKAFGMEGFEIRKFGEAARNLLRENMRWIRAMAATGPVMDVLGAVVVSMILFFARGEIKADRMTIGSFGAFTFALFKAYEPIKRLGGIYQLFVQALGTSAQVFRFLDLPEEKLDAPGAQVLPRFSTSVEFDDATFVYEDGESATLKNINLKVPAGAVVAIVGSSGAGKTTLVNLLPRFFAATSGVVRIDGHDVRDLTLRSLREQMAIV
ncbi:MAG: ABC transporter ATP-binding protein, partial [Candidatus Acidiferrales bacterium]